MSNLPSITMLDATTLSAHRIAARAVVADIETEGVAVGPRHDRTYDVRPMLDEHEHSAEVVDMAREALRYALARGLVTQVDERQPHILRVVHGSRHGALS